MRALYRPFERPDEDLPAGLMARARRPVRWDLVLRVRAEIARGTCDTPQKWQRVVERLLEEVGGA